MTKPPRLFDVRLRSYPVLITTTLSFRLLRDKLEPFLVTHNNEGFYTVLQKFVDIDIRCRSQPFAPKLLVESETEPWSEDLMFALRRVLLSMMFMLYCCEHIVLPSPLAYDYTAAVPMWCDLDILAELVEAHSTASGRIENDVGPPTQLSTRCLPCNHLWAVEVDYTLEDDSETANGSSSRGQHNRAEYASMGSEFSAEATESDGAGIWEDIKLPILIVEYVKHNKTDHRGRLTMAMKSAFAVYRNVQDVSSDWWIDIVQASLCPSDRRMGFRLRRADEREGSARQTHATSICWNLWMRCAASTGAIQFKRESSSDVDCIWQDG
ncbi:hypothetical protein C8Q74DRAFT_1439342 [Fomes fomentarius]|nr:hypothetical protein C8Q74DRAFT_1439342 [Fomes fomentarius]